MGLWNYGTLPIGEPVLTSCMSVSQTLYEVTGTLIHGLGLSLPRRIKTYYCLQNPELLYRNIQPFRSLLCISRSISPSPSETPKRSRFLINRPLCSLQISFLRFSVLRLHWPLQWITASRISNAAAFPSRRTPNLRLARTWSRNEWTGILRIL